jgi:voltage-gated potassium channel Kch|tara:strand:- start:1626 stop:2084 length:459 start_codon:yes stop_codon:yes gene_type:complete
LSKAFLLWWIQVVTVLFAAILIFTYGWFDKLWDADQTKISFIIITIFFATSIATGFLSFRSDTQYIKLSNYIWFASETMVTLGLIGTVAGFLLMLSSAFDNLDVSNVENVQKVISNMALGMSTALCTTLSGLVGSVLTKVQMVILENNTKYE